MSEKTYTDEEAAQVAVRYADDFVILAREWKDGFRQKVENAIEGRFGLVVNRDKTRCVDMKAPHESLSKGEAQLIAVCGRRRVGKTYLVREAFGDRFFFHHSGLAKGTLDEQLAAFRDSLAKYGLTNVPALANWREAFNELERLIESGGRKKKVLFIDELPWLDAPKSGFALVLSGNKLMTTGERPSLGNWGRFFFRGGEVCLKPRKEVNVMWEYGSMRMRKLGNEKVAENENGL